MRRAGAWGWVVALVAVLAAPAAAQDPRAEGMRLRNEAVALFRQGEYEKSAERERAALAVFVELKDAAQQAWSHNNLAACTLHIASREAVAQYAKALRQAQEAGVAEQENSVLRAFGALSRGPAASARLFQMLLDVLSPDNLHARREVLILQRDFHLRHGDQPAALAALDALVRAMQGYGYGEAEAIHSRGFLRDDMGQVREAAADYRAALAIWERIGDLEGQGWSSNNLGYALCRTGENAEAERHLKQALALFTSIRHREGQLRAQSNLVNLYRATGQEAALAASEEQLARLQRAGQAARPGRASVSSGAPRSLDEFKPRDVIFEVTWDGAQFTFGGPMGGGLHIGAHHQVSDAEANGVKFRVARNRLWFGERMIFLAQGETAEVTRGGYLRLKKK